MLIEEQCPYSNALDTENQSHEGSNGHWFVNMTLSGLQRTTSRRYPLSAKGQTTLRTEHFCSKSVLVPWQDDMIATNVQTNTK